MSPILRHLSRADVLGCLALAFGLTACGVVAWAVVAGRPSLTDALHVFEALAGMAVALLARSGGPPPAAA